MSGFLALVTASLIVLPLAAQRPASAAVAAPGAAAVGGSASLVPTIPIGLNR